MANKYVKRCSTSLVIRDVQIKTVRYHFTLTRMAIIKKKKKLRKTNVDLDVEKLPEECKLVKSLWKTVWAFLKNC